MSDAASRLPNLYQLLGLAPLESDQGQIAAAIKRLQNSEGNQAGAGPEELQRIGRIVSLAQKYLLDPQRKAAYDQQWKSVYQTHPTVTQRTDAPVKNEPTKSEKNEPVKSAPAKTAQVNTPEVKSATSSAPTKASPAPRAAAPTPTTTAAASASTSAANTASAVAVPNTAWDYRRLDQLLPPGDPQAAFDMASFLRTGGESRDPLAAQADLSKLIALLSDGSSGAGDASAAAMALGEPVGAGHTITEARDTVLDISPSARGGPSGSPSGGLARRMRQRKQRALIFGGTILAAGVGGLVLLAVYLFGPKSEPETMQLARAVQNKPAPPRGSGLPKIDLAAAPAAAEVQADATPLGSGLPRPGEGAMNLQVDPSTPTTSPAEPKPEPNAIAAPAAQPPAPAPEPKPQPEPKPEGEPKPASEPASEAKPQPVPTPAVDPELTGEEKRTWQKGMTKAKQLIGEHKFEEAEQQLTGLKEAAKTGQQRGQLERLEQVLGFVKDIRQAMAEAIASLEPADTFKIGTSTIASFVEGNDERITVRVAGERRSYALEDAPVRIGLALVDLKMDIEHPTTLARKGAYILTHPSNKMVFEQGKQMLQTATDAGAITPELAKFYEDDYSLSKRAD